MSTEEDRQREMSDHILEFARRMEKSRREHTGSELDEKTRWVYTECAGRSFGDPPKCMVCGTALGPRPCPCCGRPDPGPVCDCGLVRRDGRARKPDRLEPGHG